MTSPRFALVLALATATLSALCSSCTSTDEEPIGPFPPRPATIMIDSIDPCAMLGLQQSKDLKVRRPTPRTFPVDGRPSPGCTWITDSDLGYNAQKIPIGAEVAAGDPAGAVITINGFGAVRRPVGLAPSENALCQVTVDAAPGNSIRVQAQSTPGGSRRSDEEMCRLATDAASKVMTTVVAISHR